MFSEDQNMADINAIRIETELDADLALSADLANASFQRKDVHFTKSYLAWFYNQGFGGSTTIVAAYQDEEKIGQAVILWHPIRIDGKSVQSAQLVDLFVSPKHRSFSVVRAIYAGLERELSAHTALPVITVPNSKSGTLNRRFLKLVDIAIMDIRIGFSLPGLTGIQTESVWFNKENPEETVALISECIENSVASEVIWTAQSMIARLSKPNHHYAIHRSGTLCAITRFGYFRRMPAFLICGLFAGEQVHPQHTEMRHILASASRMHRCPFFVYIGKNSRAPLPGFAIPDKYRPSPMRLQGKFEHSLAPIKFDRFETIDFDFA